MKSPIIFRKNNQQISEKKNLKVTFWSERTSSETELRKQPVYFLPLANYNF